MESIYWRPGIIIMLILILTACGGDPEPAVDVDRTDSEAAVATATPIAEEPTALPEAAADAITDTVDVTETMGVTDTTISDSDPITDIVTDTATMTDTVPTTDTVDITDTAQMIATSAMTDGADMVSAAAVTETVTGTATNRAGVSETLDLTDTTPITEIIGMTETMLLTDTSPVTETATMTDTTGMGMQGADRRLVRATDLEGYDVQNPAGESLGSVEDAIIDLANGQILLLTVEYGGFLDIGDKTFPIPLSAFRLVEETRTIAQPGAPLTPEASIPLAVTEAATDTVQVTGTVGTVGIVTDTLVLDTLLVLDIPQETFENAPGFDDDLLALTEPATVGEIEGFYQSLGEDVTVQTIELADLAAMQGTAVTLSDLLGSNVQNSAAEDLGEVEELLIRLSDGQVAYVVLSFDGFLGIGDSTYAVPMESITVVPSVEPGDAPALLLDVTEEQLETVPTFDEVDLDDFTWDEEVRSYWLTEEE